VTRREPGGDPVRPIGMRWAAAAAGAAIAGVLAGVLAGCGQASYVVGPDRDATFPARPYTQPQPALQFTRPRQAAQQAATVLASFVPPPGAVRAAAVPAALRQPPSVMATLDLATATSYWRAPGSPAAVLGWEAAHLPRRFTGSASGSASTAGVVQSRFQGFSLPSVAGLYSTRQLLVSVASAGAGQTAIRVDAQVTWLPAKPAAERIPDSATAVVIALRRGMNSRGAPIAPVTVTKPAAVQRIAAIIDGLPVFPPGTYSCPADFGGGMLLTFRAGPRGPEVATADVQVSGCGGVSLTVTGAPDGMPALAGDAQTADQIASAAGIRLSGYRSLDW
jgi:hypothetical protein